MSPQTMDAPTKLEEMPLDRGVVFNVEDRSSLRRTGRRRKASTSAIAGSRSRARIYSRYSSLNQRELSETRQFEVGDIYASTLGLEVTGRYSDRGKSGTTTVGRKALEQMLADARAGDFDILIVEQIDRLSRDEGDLHAIVKTLKHAGVEIHESTWGKVTGLVITAKGMIASQARVTFLERARDGRRRQAQAGKVSNKRPYGYAMDPKVRGGLIHHPHRLSVVRRIFEALDFGEDAGDVAAALSGVEACPGACAEADRAGVDVQVGVSGGVWTRSMIMSIARSPIYMGLIVDGRTENVPNPHNKSGFIQITTPPDQWDICFVEQIAVVPIDRWKRVQDRIALGYYGGRSDSVSVRFLSSGKVFCDDCGVAAKRLSWGEGSKYTCIDSFCRGFGRPRLQWIENGVIIVLLRLVSTRSFTTLQHDILRSSRMQPEISRDGLESERQALEVEANNLVLGSLRGHSLPERRPAANPRLETIERRIEEIDAILQSESLLTNDKCRAQTSVNHTLLAMERQAGKAVPPSEELQFVSQAVRSIRVKVADTKLVLTVEVNLDALTFTVSPTGSERYVRSHIVEVDIEKAEEERSIRQRKDRVARREQRDEHDKDKVRDVSDDVWMCVEPILSSFTIVVSDLGWDLRGLTNAMLYRLVTWGNFDAIPQSFGPPATFEAACRRVVVAGAWDSVVAAIQVSSSATLVGADYSRMNLRVLRRKALKRIPDDSNPAEKAGIRRCIDRSTDADHIRRLSAIAMRLDGVTAKEVARRARVPEHVVAAWHHLYRAGGERAIFGRDDGALAASASAEFAAEAVKDGSDITRRRMLAVSRYLLGNDLYAIAEDLGSQRNTIRLWIADFMRGGIDVLRFRKPSRRLSEAQMDTLRKIVNSGMDPSDPTKPLNRRRLVTLCSELFGVKYSFNGLSNLLRREGTSISTRKVAVPSTPTITAIRMADEAQSRRVDLRLLSND